MDIRAGSIGRGSWVSRRTISRQLQWRFCWKTARAAGTTRRRSPGRYLPGRFRNMSRVSAEAAMPTNRYLAQLKRMDWLLMVAMLLLMAGSVAFIYSASYRGPGQAMPNYYKMQMVWFGIGLALYVVAVVVDYRLICHWS